MNSLNMNDTFTLIVERADEEEVEVDGTVVWTEPVRSIQGVDIGLKYAMGVKLLGSEAETKKLLERFFIFKEEQSPST